MTHEGSHPAVLAGLLGSAAWGVPSVALAKPVDNVVEAVQGSLLLQFVVGCAMGAAIAGVVSLVADRVMPGDEMDESQADDDRWSSSSLNIMRAQEQQADDDPTGDLGRYRTGQITVDLAALAQAQQASGTRRPRHRAEGAARTRAARERQGRHFASAAAEETLFDSLRAAQQVAGTMRRGRHFAATQAQRQSARRAAHFAVAQAEPTPVAAVAPTQKAGPARHAESQGRSRLAALPKVESRHAHASHAAVSANASLQAGEGSDGLQKTATLAGRPQKDEGGTSRGITGRIRARVREVLAERLSGDALEGVPVITRADGSSIDVEATWFDQNVVPALASLTGVTSKLDDTASHGIDAADKPQARPSAGQPSAAARASYISRHVAEVNVGIFPETRSADDLEHEDAWEEALHAMGEAIASETPVFHDVVGGPSTIDDPDGLEAPTGFIPFKVPAAHPEVVDTDTYVDYLLRDELSHNGSQVLRRSSHAHLRVIEGGTGKLRTRRSEEGAQAGMGRHFAQPLLAREA